MLLYSCGLRVINHIGISRGQSVRDMHLQYQVTINKRLYNAELVSYKAFECDN